MIIENREDIKRLIKSATAARGLTMAGLSEKIGVFPASLSRTLNNTDISMRLLLAIASALDSKVKIEFIPAAGDQAAQHNE
jgi:transcriptional regulator with XRE-family HTH domain